MLLKLLSKFKALFYQSFVTTMNIYNIPLKLNKILLLEI